MFRSTSSRLAHAASKQSSIDRIQTTTVLRTWGKAGVLVGTQHITPAEASQRAVAGADLFIGVVSSPTHRAARDSQRSTWMQSAAELGVSASQSAQFCSRVDSVVLRLWSGSLWAYLDCLRSGSSMCETSRHTIRTCS